MRVRGSVRGRVKGSAVLAAALAFAACTRRTTASLEETPSIAEPAPTSAHGDAPEPSAPVSDSAPEEVSGPCAQTPSPLPASAHRAACEPGRAVERVSLLHVGDTHGHFHSYLSGNRSPYAVLRGLVERRRLETGGRVLFLDAGDALEKGSLAELRTQGAATLDLLDRLGLDARTIGNHDFAWGLPSVVRQLQAPHPVLGSNLHPTALPEQVAFKRTLVFEIGCVRVGLFGLVTNPYDETDDRYDGPYLGAVAQEHDHADADRYVNLAAALTRELREEQKVDVVVALDHLGLARDRLLVDTVAGLDLVISAHDHVAIPGPVQGRHGVLVSTGAWLGGRSEARVGETTLEVDPKTKTARVVSAAAHKLEEQRDLDPKLQAEVDRVLACHAKDAEEPLAELESPLGPWQIDTWTSMLDAALRARFPQANALFYEAWAWNGIVRGELPRGPVSAQALADFAFSERQKVGGPGFTAFEELVVDGNTLAELCAAWLREPSVGQRMHRVCPGLIEPHKTYRLVIERRALHAPHLAFVSIPKTWPKPPVDESAAVEAYEVLTEYARARGKSCKALDRDAPAACR